MMTALTAMNDDWPRRDDTPLARAMAELALQVVRRIVVRSPIVALLHETTRMSEAGPVHEVSMRTGVLLRSPTKLLRLRWPPFPPASRPAPSNEAPRRA